MSSKSNLGDTIEILATLSDLSGEIINPDEIISGKVIRDTDTYLLEVKAGESFFFDIEDGEDNVDWSLIDPNGNIIFKKPLSRFGGEGSYTLTTTGLYTLLIEGSTKQSLYSKGSYSFQVIDQEEEPTILSLGEIVTNTIRENKYSFTLESNSLLYFDSLIGDFYYDYTWRIEDENGTKYYAQKFYQSNGFFLDNPVFNLPAGEYFLIIDTSNIFADSTYSFRLSDLSQAPTITQGEIVTGEILKDTDIYQLQVEAGDKFFFDIESIETQGDNFILIDPVGNVELNVPLTEALIEANYILNKSGNYTILVESEYGEGDSYYYDDPNNYSFKILHRQENSNVLNLGEKMINTSTQAEYNFILESDSLLYFDSLTDDSNYTWTIKGSDQVEYYKRTFTSSDSDSIKENPVLELAAGQYILSVTSSDENSKAHSFALLDLLQGETINTDIEIGDSLTKNTKIYNLDVTAGEWYFFSLNEDESYAYNTYWRLIDPVGNLLFEGDFDDFGGYYNFSELGTYTILVEADINNNYGSNYYFTAFEEEDLTPINLGETIASTIEEAKYIFTLDSFTTLYFDSLENSDTNIDWILKDQKRNVIFDSDAQNDQLMTFLDAGEYILEVNGSGENTGSYSFRILDWDNVPTINFDEVVNGDLGNSLYQTDFYRFTGENDQRINLYLISGGTPNSPNYLGLYDKRGVLLDGFHFRDQSSIIADIELSLPYTGEYFIGLNGNGDSNNLYSFNLTIPPIADLQVSSANISKSIVSPGESIQIDWDIINQGTANTENSWVDSVYLSSDGIFNPPSSSFYYTFSDKLLLDENSSPLAVGESYSRNGTLTIANNEVAGNRFLFFSTDRNNNEVESDETNNVEMISFEIHVPDLTVESLLASKTRGNFGETIDVSWLVRNIGQGDALIGWDDRLYLSQDNIISNDDYSLFNQSISTPVASNGNYTQTATVTLPLDVSLTDDTYFLLFATDSLNDQVEANEDNNVLSVAIDLIIPAFPDLVVSDIKAPIESFSGQSIELSWTITNQGEALASGSWTDRVFLSDNLNIGDDQFLDSFTFTGVLQPGESIQRKQVVTLPVDLEGNRYVLVSTDFNNQVFEFTNEDNNTTIDEQIITIELSPYPNLQVTSVAAPSTAFSSQETIIEWIVTNNGIGSTSTPNWIDKVWLSFDQNLDATDILLGEATNPSFLNVNDSYTNSLTVTLPQGIDDDYFFIVQTDANNQVLELDKEEDNYGYSDVTDIMLTPPPDLQVTSVNAPAQAFSGQSMSLSWTVTNKGLGRTLESNWVDRIYLSTDDILDESDLLLGQQFYNSGLEIGGNYNANLDVTLPIGVSGDFFFIIQTDAENQVFEQAFAVNNTGFDATPTTINLTPPPDLEVEFLNVPVEATASRSISLDYRVSNFGATSTPNSFWRDSFYLSTDNQLNADSDLFLGDKNHFGTLDIGEFYEETATFTLPNNLTGDFFIFTVTDAYDDVFELDNNNNVSLSPQLVTIVSRPADLVISAAVVSPLAEAGKSVIVEWTVSNQGLGDTAVESWTDRIIASRDEILGNEDDVVLDNFTYDGLLDVGDSYQGSEVVSIPFNFAGDYNLFVVTDADDQVFEDINDNNNSNLLAINVSQQIPDLQVTAIETPETAQTATMIPLSWTVKNLGQGQTNSNFWYDEVYLSPDQTLEDGNDIFLGRIRRGNGLNSGEDYTARADLFVPLNAIGNYYVIVRTDENNQVLEKAVENGVAELGYDVAPLTPQVWGENISPILGEQAQNSNSGIYTFIQQDLENNNDGVSVSQITIEANPLPYPDLVVETVEALDEGFSGQSLEVTWTVTNEGKTTENRNWFDSVYLSRDQIFDGKSDIFLGSSPSSNGNLATGESYTTTTNFEIPRGLSGPFYVFVTTDSSNRIYELEEQLNNSSYDAHATDIVLLPATDLVPGAIAIPTNGSSGEDITFTYTVENQSGQNALGKWTDSIYISADDQWDIDDRLLAQVSVSGPVNGGESYSQTVTAQLPGLISGDYKVIVRSDIRNEIVEDDETNNITISSETINVDIPVIEIGTPVNGTVSQGESVYYRVDVSSGETLQFVFDSLSENAVNELYISYEQMPTRGNFDFGFNDIAADQDIVIPVSEGGSYYILARGQYVPEEEVTQDYSLAVNTIDFGITDIETTVGDKGGSITFAIEGAKFNSDLTAQLENDAGEVIAANSVWYEDSTKVFVTFDLTNAAIGIYDLKVSQPSLSLELVEQENGELGLVLEDTIIESVLEDGFEVIPAQEDNLLLKVDSTPVVLTGSPFDIVVSYANNGTHDLEAPLLSLQSNYDYTRFMNIQDGDRFVEDNSMMLLAISNEGPAGILRPGETGTIRLRAIAKEGENNISIGQIVDDGTAPDYERLINYIGGDLTDSAWVNSYQALENHFGTSWSSFATGLAELATENSTLGRYSHSVNKLWADVALDAWGNEVDESEIIELDTVDEIASINLSPQTVENNLSNGEEINLQLTALSAATPVSSSFPPELQRELERREQIILDAAELIKKPQRDDGYGAKYAAEALEKFVGNLGSEDSPSFRNPNEYKES